LAEHPDRHLGLDRAVLRGRLKLNFVAVMDGTAHALHVTFPFSFRLRRHGRSAGRDAE
jgi:hypothetical protein